MKKWQCCSRAQEQTYVFFGRQSVRAVRQETARYKGETNELPDKARPIHGPVLILFPVIGCRQENLTSSIYEFCFYYNSYGIPVHAWQS